MKDINISKAVNHFNVREIEYVTTISVFTWGWGPVTISSESITIVASASGPAYDDAVIGRATVTFGVDIIYFFFKVFKLIC